MKHGVKPVHRVSGVEDVGAVGIKALSVVLPAVHKQIGILDSRERHADLFVVLLEQACTDDQLRASNFLLVPIKQLHIAPATAVDLPLPIAMLIHPLKRVLQNFKNLRTAVVLCAKGAQ